MMDDAQVTVIAAALIHLAYRGDDGPDFSECCGYVRRQLAKSREMPAARAADADREGES